jgi:hypothetical protein
MTNCHVVKVICLLSTSMLRELLLVSDYLNLSCIIFDNKFSTVFKYTVMRFIEASRDWAPYCGNFLH